MNKKSPQSIFKPPIGQSKPIPNSTLKPSKPTTSQPQPVPASQPTTPSSVKNNDIANFPISLPLINTISLLLTTFKEQSQSTFISTHLSQTICPAEKPTLASLAGSQKLSQKLAQHNQQKENEKGSLQLLTLLSLRSEPATSIPIVNSNRISQTSTTTSNPTTTTPKSTQQQYPNRTNNCHNPAMKSPRPPTPTPSSLSSTTSKTNPSSSSSSPSAYLNTPLQQTDPLLLYHLTQQLSTLFEENHILTRITYKYRSQLRRQTYFSWIQRCVRKARVLSTHLTSLMGHIYTLIYGYFDLIQQDAAVQKLQRAKGGAKPNSSNSTPTNNASNNDAQEIGGKIINLFGTEYSSLIYQGLARMYIELDIQSTITAVLDSVLGLFISCIKTIPQLTQMIYATYLLPFCLTATSIIAKIIQLCRSLLLLLFPLYLSSTPTSIVTTPVTITPQQIWHQLLRYQLELHCLQTVSFENALSSISMTHLSNSTITTASHGDYLPPQVEPAGGVQRSIGQFPIKAQFVNSTQQPPLPHTQPTPLRPIPGNKKRDKVKLSNLMFTNPTQATSITQPTQQPTTTISQPLTMSQYYLSYLKSSKPLSTLVKNPIYSIPLQKLPQLHLLFRPLQDVGDNSSIASKYTSGDIKPPQPMAFTGQLYEFFSNLVTSPFPTSPLPLSLDNRPPTTTMSDHSSPIFLTSKLINEPTNYQLSLPPPANTFSYPHAQEILLYLFSTTTRANQTTQSPYHSILSMVSKSPQNSNAHKTFYNPELNSYLNSTTSTSTSTPASVSYHWYLFTTTLLINGAPNNNMVISHYPQNLNANLSINNGDNLYQSLDWIDNAMDLVQPNTTIKTITPSLIDFPSPSQSTNNFTTPSSTSLSLLNRVEKRLPNRKHKPITTNSTAQSNQQHPTSTQKQTTQIDVSPKTTMGNAKSPNSALNATKNNKNDTFGGLVAAVSSSDDEDDRPTIVQSIPTMCDSTASDTDSNDVNASRDSDDEDIVPKTPPSNLKSSVLKQNLSNNPTTATGTPKNEVNQLRNQKYKQINPLQSISDGASTNTSQPQGVLPPSTNAKSTKIEPSVVQNQNVAAKGDSNSNPIKKQKFSLKSLMASCAENYPGAGHDDDGDEIVTLTMETKPQSTTIKKSSMVASPKQSSSPSSLQKRAKVTTQGQDGQSKAKSTMKQSSSPASKSSSSSSATPTTSTFNPFLGATPSIGKEGNKSQKTTTKKDKGRNSLDDLFSKSK